MVGLVRIFFPSEVVVSQKTSPDCPREIERRWRIPKLPERVVPLPSVAIVQGYAECPREELFVRERLGSEPFEIVIHTPPTEQSIGLEWSSFVPEAIFLHLSEPKNQGKVRIRQIDGTVSILTVKADGTIERPEWEKPVPRQVARHLFTRSDQRLVFKNRTHLPTGERVLEFDVFHQKLSGLLIVECEFPSTELACAFTLPDWIEGAIEVTEDKRFSNKNLATYGLPTL